jgi:hypothetical protein
MFNKQIEVFVALKQGLLISEDAKKSELIPKITNRNITINYED